MCLPLTRLDRSSGWEEEGGGALDSEVSRREEQQAGRARCVSRSRPGLVEDGGARGEPDELSLFPFLGRSVHVFPWNAVPASLSIYPYRDAVTPN